LRGLLRASLSLSLSLQRFLESSTLVGTPEAFLSFRFGDFLSLAPEGAVPQIQSNGGLLRRLRRDTKVDVIDYCTCLVDAMADTGTKF
jgi:hypothetical protein